MAHARLRAPVSAHPINRPATSAVDVTTGASQEQSCYASLLRLKQAMMGQAQAYK